MRYVLVDSHGTTLGSYTEREAALQAYAELVEEDPSAAEDVALLACDDSGVAQERIDAPAAAAALHQ